MHHTAHLDPRRQCFHETIGRKPPPGGRLQGRRILVVGAGQRTIDQDKPPIGNGRAISVLFAREGASVVCADISESAAKQTCELIRDGGGTATAALIDVADVQSIGPLLNHCVAKMGGLDGLVMVVGVSSGLRLDEQTVQAWDHDFAVNVRSNMLFAQQALRRLDAGASIVLVSSLTALRNFTLNPAYETTKAAQVALARAIAVAGQSQGIRCNTVLPGFIDTPLGRSAAKRRPDRAASPLPFGRQGTGWEVAYAALFLISHESSYVNAHALVVDGGFIGGVVLPPS